MIENLSELTEEERTSALELAVFKLCAVRWDIDYSPEGFIQRINDVINEAKDEERGKRRCVTR